MFDKLKGIIYGVFTIIITIITIRFLLEFIGASQRNQFVAFWMNLSQYFVNPWVGMAPNIRLFGSSILELDSIVAIGFYLIFGLLLEKSADSMTGGSAKSLLVSIVDTVFKIVEFLLITRLIFRLIGIGNTSWFADFIYSITSWIISPFGKFVNDYKFGFVTVEVSTLITLIIIVILDAGVTELFRMIFKRAEEKKEK